MQKDTNELFRELKALLAEEMEERANLKRSLFNPHHTVHDIIGWLEEIPEKMYERFGDIFMQIMEIGTWTPENEKWLVDNMVDPGRIGIDRYKLISMIRDYDINHKTMLFFCRNVGCLDNIYIGGPSLLEEVLKKKDARMMMILCRMGYNWDWEFPLIIIHLHAYVYTIEISKDQKLNIMKSHFYGLKEWESLMELAVGPSVPKGVYPELMITWMSDYKTIKKEDYEFVESNPYEKSAHVMSTVQLLNHDIYTIKKD